DYFCVIWHNNVLI
nr:immunoglobulin light chain junction region [Macaca mulatta]MOY07863.1 immunoglobulin light chain junction region [Macaca mulatta]